MVNCSSDDLLNIENSQKSLKNIIFKIRKPLLTKSISWQNLNDLNELDYKSAFSYVKSTHTNQQTTQGLSSGKNILNHSSNSSSREATSSLNSTFKSTRSDINSTFNSISNNSSALDPSIYFSPITVPSNSNSPSMDKSVIETKIESETPVSPHLHPCIRRRQSLYPSTHSSAISGGFKKRHSLANPSVLQQFQIENRLKNDHHIYGSSQEFLAHLDMDIIKSNNEATFATTHHPFHSIPADQRIISPSAITNKSLKILDKNHKNQADSIFTIFAVLAYVLITNVKYMIIFAFSSYLLMVYFSLKMVTVGMSSLYNMWWYLFLLPFKFIGKVGQLFFSINST